MIQIPFIVAILLLVIMCIMHSGWVFAQKGNSAFTLSTDAVMQLLDGENVHYFNGRWYSQPLAHNRNIPFAETTFLSKAHHVNVSVTESEVPILDGADNYSISGQYFLSNEWYFNLGFASGEQNNRAYRLAIGRFLYSTLDIQFAWLGQDEGRATTPEVVYNLALLSRGESYEGIPVALPISNNSDNTIEAKIRYIGVFDNQLTYAASLFLRFSDVDSRIDDVNFDDDQAALSLRFKLYPTRKIGLGAEFSSVYINDNSYTGFALYGNYFYRPNINFTGRMALASDRPVGQEGFSLGVNFLF